MQWNFIFLLSLFGSAMAAASLFGFTEGIELFLWIVVALIAAFVPFLVVHKALKARQYKAFL